MIGLLADVDGPVCNPDHKAITKPEITSSLVKLANSGVAVVFNTGRSADFVERQVFTPLLQNGLHNFAVVHAVCEKGGVWLSLDERGEVHEFADETITTPADMQNAVRKLVADEFGDTSFYDETKRTMISTERRPDVDHDTYIATQPGLVRRMHDALLELGYDAIVGHESPGAAEYRIDPSIIAVDIEVIGAGKDVGAVRAVELLAGRNVFPDEWRTIGDSGSDYAMAQWLYDNGRTVKHVDVATNPHHGDYDFEVLRPKHCHLDGAAARYLRWITRRAEGVTTPPEDEFEEQL